MEKEWEDFWVTGRITDYLSYKDHYKQETEEQKLHGTNDYSHGNGDGYHAYIGL